MSPTTPSTTSAEDTEPRSSQDLRDRNIAPLKPQLPPGYGSRPYERFVCQPLGIPRRQRDLARSQARHCPARRNSADQHSYCQRPTAVSKTSILGKIPEEAGQDTAIHVKKTTLLPTNASAPAETNKRQRQKTICNNVNTTLQEESRPLKQANVSGLTTTFPVVPSEECSK